METYFFEKKNNNNIKSIYQKVFYIYRLPQGLHRFKYVSDVVNVIFCPGVVCSDDVI